MSYDIGSGEQRSYETTAHLVAALAGQCAGAPEKIIDLLTGYLWDEEEAVRLKNTAALSPAWAHFDV